LSHRLYNYFISFHFSGAFAQLRLRGKIFEKEVRGIYCTWGAVPKQQLQQQRPPPPPSAPMRQQSFFSTTITNATMKRREKKNVTTTTTKHHHHHPSSILIPIQLTLKIQYYHRSQITGHRHSFSARPGPRPTFQHLGDSIASLFPRKLGVKRQRVCTLP
jgi:hypothetical protein